MTRKRMCAILAVVFAGSLLAAGCNDKQQMEMLQQKNATLEKALGDARAQYAQTAAENQQLQSQLAEKDSEINRLKGNLAGKSSVKLAPTTPTGAGGWEVGLTGDRVTLESDILFASGKADLTAAGKSALDKVAADLKKTYGGMPVRVYGFTDTDPIVKTKKLWADNLDLSANRAMTVTRYLISKGTKAAAIETVAMGDTRPVGTNKAKSRRVEIVVIKTGAVAGAKAKPAEPAVE